MSKTLSEEILSSVKELITALSNFEEGTAPFNHVLKYFITRLKKSDIMYFANKKDIDQNVDGMSEKFSFHGFFRQAEALKCAYKLYIPDILPKSESMNRLNMVKFLLCMSESPTKHFLENPEITIQHTEPEEEINWVEYLNEGVEEWNPNFEETSDEESYNSADDFGSTEPVTASDSVHLLPKQIQSNERMHVMDLRASREELLATVQHAWFNQKRFFMEPESQLREANIGILWEKFLKDQAQGLVCIETSSVITEYKVIREILWQLWGPHTSATFQLTGNSLKPKTFVTLASVRPHTFYGFLHEFVPYIELLDYFKKFGHLLQFDLDENEHVKCRTYRSYYNCMYFNVIHPLYQKLCDIEKEVSEQEETYTLLKLADELGKVFETITELKRIHDQVTIKPDINLPLKCATTLIVRLHESLHFSSSKLEQDLKLTLFLGTLYHYLGLVNSWFTRDDLSDYTEEFVIEKTLTAENCINEFVPRENIDDCCKENGILKIFSEKVLKIGRNIDFLLFLRKYDKIADYQGTMYEEFISKVLEKLEEFRNISNTEQKDKTDIIENEDHQVLIREDKFICPVLPLSCCTTYPDFEKLENLANTTNGFLMAAFADFFVEQPLIEETKKQTLYERISTIHTNLFPIEDVFEIILSNMLDERLTISGLMVKNCLVEEHLLKKNFEFLKRLYLFIDDIIFPFYRRIFEKTDFTNTNWTNIWLTSHLQDIFMDIYPEFYEKCSVQVKNWSLCSDSLSACRLINISYEIQMPLSIIIKQEQIELYKEIFQFLLMLKWALYNVNHLAFSDLEVKTNASKTFNSMFYKSKVSTKLMRLKFYLLNILNSLQHFVFGSIFTKNLVQIELDWEKACDLNSLIDAHSDFINSVWSTIKDLRERMFKKDELSNVLACVRLLKLMWNDVEFATSENIKNCYQMYQSFYNDISPIIFPVYIYDY